MYIVEIAFGLSYWVAPVVVGNLLARFCPRLAWWKVGLLAGLPFALLMLGMAIWIAITADITTCANPPCHNMAPIFFWALLVGSVFTLAVGFGMGQVGRALAPKAPAAKED